MSLPTILIKPSNIEAMLMLVDDQQLEKVKHRILLHDESVGLVENNIGVFVKFVTNLPSMENVTFLTPIQRAIIWSAFEQELTGRDKWREPEDGR